MITVLRYWLKLATVGILVAVVFQQAVAADRRTVYREFKAIQHSIDSGLKVRLEKKQTDSKKYILGDLYRYSVTSNVPGYFTLFVVRGGGAVFALPPIAHSNNTADTYQTYPSHVEDNWATFLPPVGRDRVYAVFTTESVSEVFTSFDNRAGKELSVGELSATLEKIAKIGGQIDIAHKGYSVDPRAGLQYDTSGIISEMKNSGKVDMNDVRFHTDSAELTGIARAQLSAFADALRRLSNNDSIPSVSLIGHTDSVGEHEYNLDLSLRRAKAARNFLVDQFSLPKSRLLVDGKGETQPLDNNNSEQSRSRNRRVEAKIVQ